MEQNINPKFKTRFYQLRDELNMTQAAFAQFLGISRPTVGFYENGSRIPDAQTLADIACHCNVSTDWLVGISDYRRDEVRGYNLEDMRFTEKAANTLGVLSTAEFIASRQEQASEESILMGNAYGLLVKLLEDPKFIEFLHNASAYVQADAECWTNHATMTLSSGKKISAPATYAKDLFWAHCTAPLKECLSKIEFSEQSSGRHLPNIPSTENV